MNRLRNAIKDTVKARITSAWSKSVLLDFVVDNQHGGWAWNGTYWQVHYVGWTYNVGASADVTFTVMGHS